MKTERKDYYLVHKSALPSYFGKVLEAKELLRSGKVRNISAAAAETGISRSTFYKYKDYVFPVSESDASKKAVLSMILYHERGNLSKVLNELAEGGANILTITQNPPISNRASVVISMDITGLKQSLSDLIKALAALPGVEMPKLIDIA